MSVSPPVTTTPVSKRVGVFLSYAHEDDDIVTVFQHAFEELGKEVGQNLDVYRDRTSISAGISISKKIQEDLRMSDYLVVFYTGTFQHFPGFFNNIHTHLFLVVLYLGIHR